MEIYIDEQFNQISQFNSNMGFVISEDSIIATSAWVEEQKEQGHYVEIKSYPETGGADVEWVVDCPAKGHWKTDFTKEIAGLNYEPIVPEYVNKESQVYEETLHIKNIHIYTDSELKAKQDREGLIQQQAELKAEYEKTNEQLMVMIEDVLLKSETAQQATQQTQPIKMRTMAMTAKSPSNASSLVARRKSLREQLADIQTELEALQ